jgi:uncharacterized protein Usg
MADLERQLIKPYRLTTAEILYHLPDYPELLQSFIWQDYDLAPRYPVLTHFLGFWTREIEGKLHSVYVASQKLITPSDVRFADLELTLH